LVNGVGFHNAGLDSTDWYLIENAFRKGKLKVLVTTQTLAVGVNLPCYLVIIKGT
jgi:ATP-dependent DNA helicase HFM1/MER3